VKIKGQQWNITAALAGEPVQIVAVEERLLIFYCQTLIRELDPDLQRSTIVERWRNDPSSNEATVKDV
jgi:hypothetical protein